MFSLTYLRCTQRLEARCLHYISDDNEVPHHCAAQLLTEFLMRTIVHKCTHSRARCVSGQTSHSEKGTLQQVWTLRIHQAISEAIKGRLWQWRLVNLGDYLRNA